MSIGRRISVKKAKGKHKCHAVNLSFLAENIATQPSLAGDWAELGKRKYLVVAAAS